MNDAVTKQHAHTNTVYHCLYGYYNLGYSKKELARVYNKCERTIANWVRVSERSGCFQRAIHRTDRKFTDVHRQWLVDFYFTHPLAHLDEAQDAFQKFHHLEISKSSVWRIIHQHGLTWKVLDRRAMHIKESDIFRFVEELSHINWCHANVVFLDEVSFDNKGMIRRRGYAFRGKSIAIRGDFQRKPRVSLLAFIGVDGLIDCYNTDGTFDRAEFLRCCQSFAYSKQGCVRQYPGKNSVWIMDGASIHRDPEIVYYLRSIGIVVIFLPAIVHSLTRSSICSVK